MVPIAVLSSLTLGLAVDFSIHFLSRAREFYEKEGSWSAVSESVFGEPARAILRNVILLFSGLMGRACVACEERKLAFA